MSLNSVFVFQIFVCSMQKNLTSDLLKKKKKNKVNVANYVLTKLLLSFSFFIRGVSRADNSKSSRNFDAINPLRNAHAVSPGQINTTKKVYRHYVFRAIILTKISLVHLHLFPHLNHFQITGVLFVV